MNRPAVGRLVAYAAVVLVGAAGMWRVESTAHTAQDTAETVAVEREAAAVRSCEVSNETRDQIRRMSRDAPIEVGEAIIEVASEDGEPPDPAVIEQFRAVMARRLEGIVNQLPARRWDPELGECVDVPIDTGG